jgi:hypothetical protein
MASPSWSDAVIDGGIDYIRNNCTRVDVCTTEPTTYTEATSTYSVASYVVDSSDFTKANGDVSGRKVTLAQQTGNNGTGTGAANFLAFSKTTGSEFLGVIDGDGDTVNSGSPVTINAVVVWEIRDPA